MALKNDRSAKGIIRRVVCITCPENGKKTKGGMTSSDLFEIMAGPRYTDFIYLPGCSFNKKDIYCNYPLLFPTHSQPIVYVDLYV
jgi:hypothetical protein